MQKNEAHVPTTIFSGDTSRFHNDERISVSPPRELGDIKASSASTSPSTVWSADKAIAEALGKLSLKEREQAYEDVHGISRPVDETPEMIADSMQKLVSELATIKSKPAYDAAMELSETFVTNHSFRLSFLRAECFNPAKAAARMVAYFDKKKELFGVEMLTKPITYEDLDSDAKAAVARGSMSILPTRDALGRYVFVSAAEHHLPSLLKESIMSKALWYILNTIAEDEISQKKGFVIITYALGSKLQPTEARKRSWAASAMVGYSIPLRNSSFHHCYENSVANPMLKIIAMVGSTWFCTRLRTHKGSHSECQYKLMTFGIAIKDFPVTVDGQLKPGRHKGWLERRKQKENFLKTHAKIPDGAVDIPLNFDVLLGKGMPCQEHPGNKHLHELVALRYKEYDTAKRERKTEIAEEIVRHINENSGRFLKRDDKGSGMWVEVSSREARDKVCHGFRRKREWDLKKPKTTSVKSTKAAVSTIDKKDDKRQKRLKMSVED